MPATPTPGATQPAQPPRIGGDAPLVDSPNLRIYGRVLTVSNAYLIATPAGVTLVDAGLPTAAGEVLRWLKRIGRAGDLCQIFITHAHIDHFGAAAALRTQTGAQILIHADDADALTHGRTALGNVRNWAWAQQPLPAIEKLLTIAQTPPDRTLSDGERITSCGLDATLLHTPGHIPGSSTLLVNDPATGARYAFVGDLIATTGGAHVQTSYAHDWAQIGPSLERLRAAQPALVFPGHGRAIMTGAELSALELTGPAAAHTQE